MNTQLVFPASTLSVLKAAGVRSQAGLDLPPCALNIGDVIRHPEAPNLFWRVTSRWLDAGTDETSARWYVYLEPAPDPRVVATPPAPPVPRR